jgi:xanthine dehydrogenase YagT iron-sulfur-binding subunit
MSGALDACLSASRRNPRSASVRRPAALLTIAHMEHCMALSTTLTINGVTRTIELDDPRVTLLDLLRERLDLTGTKKGCDRGQCGACTVIVGGRRINSCLALAVSHDGAHVLTIEGVAEGKSLHPVQEAFLAHDGLQCGFCTPGQIMSAIGLIEEGHAGDDPERVREGMSGNLCRCGAYQGITEAVLDAQRTLAAQSRKEVA